MTQPDQILSVIRHELTPNERPLLIVPSFTWDAEKSMGPLKAQFEQLGYPADHILVGDYYDRTINGTVTDPADAAVDPTEAHADRLLEQIEAAGLQNTPLNVVAASYGSLIYEAALYKSMKKGWTALAPKDDEDTREVIFLAPSGTLPNETVPRLMRRYAYNVASLALSGRLNPATRTQLMRFAKEPDTRMKETSRLAHETVSYPELRRMGINVHIVAYFGDKTFPLGEYDVALANGDPEPVWQTIGSYSNLVDRKASHSDPILEPARTAQLVHQIITNASGEWVHGHHDNFVDDGTEYDPERAE